MSWRSTVLLIPLASLVGCSPAPTISASSARPESAGQTDPDQASQVVTREDIPDDIQDDSWARLPLPRREALDPAGREAFDAVINPESRYADGPRGPIAMWLHSPTLAAHYFPGSTYVRFGTEKDQRLTELIILATAREVRSQYEWSAHEPLGLSAGLEPEVIDVVKHRRDLDGLDGIPGLDETERLLIQLVREVMNDEKVSSETFTRVRERFGEQGLMDIVGLIGHYSFINLTLKTFDVQLAPGRERLLPDLW